MQLLQGRVREEASTQAAARVQWEDERRALQDELAALLRVRGNSSYAASPGSYAAVVREEEGRRTCQILLKQGEELTRVRLTPKKEVRA